MDSEISLYSCFKSGLLFCTIVFAILYAIKYFIEKRNQRLFGTPLTIKASTIAGWILLTAVFLGSFKYAANYSENWRSSIQAEIPYSVLYVVFYRLFPMTVFIMFLFHLIPTFLIKENRIQAIFNGYTLAIAAMICSISLIIITNMFNNVK